MGSGFNLPPGCYDSDLPGWHDVERDVDFECANEECGHEWTEVDVTVDSRGDHDVEANCPECKTLKVAYYPSVERD